MILGSNYGDGLEANVGYVGGMADMTAFVIRPWGTSLDIARKALRVLGENNDAAGHHLDAGGNGVCPVFHVCNCDTNENSGIGS